MNTIFVRECQFMTIDLPVHPCDLSLEELEKQCQWITTRRRGPGGQHRNKTESAIVLTHLPTGVMGQAAERRSQADNLRVAVKRLRVNLALQVRFLSRADKAPSTLWQSRVQDQRIHVNPEHVDFPTMLAEALDVVRDRQGQIPHVAEQLQCTTTQLCKFLRVEPRAWQLVNKWRTEQGLPEWT